MILLKIYVQVFCNGNVKSMLQGQVNNILKKKRTPPRQEKSRGMARKPPPNYNFDRQGDFDAENNWSKR